MSALAHPETYRVNLPHFEGPFDLLLFFIERDELDIYDIPIAKVTLDFLDYLHAAKEMDIELASEFILVAGTLMRIKARMLLPRPVLDEAGNEVDPREELVRRLLEYKRYKEVLEELAVMEATQAERAPRGFARAEEKTLLTPDSPDEELYGLDLYALMRVFQRVIERHAAELRKPSHVIRRYPYDIEAVKSNILSRLAQAGRLDFVAIVTEHRDRVYVVFSFLAILEMIQTQQLHLVLGEGYNNFWITPKAEQQAEALEEEPNGS